MRRFTSPTFRRPAPAGLLGLGLLGLLLWGQCGAGRLREGRRSRRPTESALHLKIGVGVARLDSFSTRSPVRCYATVALQNRSDQPCRVGDLACGLHLDQRLVGSSGLQGLHDTLLPAHSEHTFTACFKPYTPAGRKKDADFQALRAAWQQNQLAQHQAEAEVVYGCYPISGNALYDYVSRTETVPLVR